MKSWHTHILVHIPIWWIEIPPIRLLPLQLLKALLLVFDVHHALVMHCGEVYLRVTDCAELAAGSQPLLDRFQLI